MHIGYIQNKEDSADASLLAIYPRLLRSTRTGLMAVQEVSYEGIIVHIRVLSRDPIQLG